MHFGFAPLQYHVSEGLMGLGRRGSYEERRSGALEIKVKYREWARTIFIPETKTLLEMKK